MFTRTLERFRKPTDKDRGYCGLRLDTGRKWRIDGGSMLFGRWYKVTEYFSKLLDKVEQYQDFGTSLWFCDRKDSQAHHECPEYGKRSGVTPQITVSKFGEKKKYGGKSPRGDLNP